MWFVPRTGFSVSRFGDRIARTIYSFIMLYDWAKYSTLFNLTSMSFNSFTTLKGFLQRWPTSVECDFRQDCYRFWTHGRTWHRAGWSGCGAPNHTGEQRRLELSCNLVWSVQTPDCSTWIWWPFLFLLIKSKCGVYTTNPTPFVASSGIFCKPWTFLQEGPQRIQGRWQWWGPGGGRCWNMSHVHVWARCWLGKFVPWLCKRTMQCCFNYIVVFVFWLYGGFRWWWLFVIGDMPIRLYMFLFPTWSNLI